MTVTSEAPSMRSLVYLEVCRCLWETEQRLSVSWLAWAMPSSLLCVWPVLPAQPLCGCLHEQQERQRETERQKDRY